MLDFNQRIQEIVRGISNLKAGKVDESQVKKITSLIDSGEIGVSDLQDLLPILEKTTKISFNLDFTKLRSASNFMKGMSKNVSLQDVEKLSNLIRNDYPNLLNEEQKFCFLESIGCSQSDENIIISAHGNQENGELSKISEKLKDKKMVYHISKKYKEKKIEQESIAQASTFKGFCKVHDKNIFEPIDINREIDDSHKHFLYSLRSFAHSYYNIRAIQDETLKCLEPMFELSSIINDFRDNKLLNILDIDTGLSERLDYKVLGQIKEQNNLTRFEKYKNFLSNYTKDEKYSELDYFVYEVNHILPIACSSWLRMDIANGNGFMVYIKDNTDTTYIGYPVILSVIPQNSSTLVLLTFFKFDSESKFISNRFKQLAKNQLKFELEISNLILQQVDNVYLNPSFWNNLSEENKQVILKGINNRKSEPFINQENQQDINFFDKKYAVTK